MIPLRGRVEIVDRLEIAAAERLLLVEAPEQLVEILSGSAAPEQTVTRIGARAIRSVKDAFDWILLWQESRVGSRALFEAAVKRLEPNGRLWVVTAMRKVQGPKTPAAHRLEAGDLTKAFAKEGLAFDREARLSAWHMAYRFARRESRAVSRKS
jgi:hypothetical protein